jgi:recombinational DNA repair ATPase RecF
MIVNLNKYIEINKEIEELKKDAEMREELNNLVAAIIKGEKIYYTDSKKLIDTLKINAKKETYNKYSMWGISKEDYAIKLNKTNIEKVNKYINEGE